MQSLVDAVVLLLVQREAGLALFGRVHHHLHDALADDWRAELNTDVLVDFSLDLLVDANHFVVATTVTTLADHALGDGVQRGQLHVVELAGLLLLQVAQALLEGDEFAREDVGLVHFVGHDHQLLLCGKLDDAANVGGRKSGTSGVAGVDDDNGADIGAVRNSLLVRSLDIREAGAPALGLVEVVGHGGGIEDSEGGGVERVLGNRNQDTGVGACADDVQERIDTSGGAIAQEDVLGVRGVAISP